MESTRTKEAVLSHVNIQHNYINMHTTNLWKSAFKIGTFTYYCQYLTSNMYDVTYLCQHERKFCWYYLLHVISKCNTITCTCKIFMSTWNFIMCTSNLFMCTCKIRCMLTQNAASNRMLLLYKLSAYCHNHIEYRLQI